jgi:fibro-slime domain-containing protein
VVDLGGWHVPVQGSFTVGSGADEFALVSGDTYEIAAFHAERPTEGSSFMIGLEGFDLGCE